MTPLKSYLWGAHTPFALAVIAVTCLLDQAIKLWLVSGFDLASKGRVHVLPFMDLVLVWNTGISYGLFAQNGPLGQWLLLGFKAAAVILLWVWLARAHTRFMALALGLIIGGALGNAIDRLAHGAVADFVLLYVDTGTWRFDWYVFNLADIGIVAGVAGLLYESLVRDGAAKAP